MTNFDSNTVKLGLQNTYARLPERFFARLSPTPVTSPELVRLNELLATEINLDPAYLSSAEGVEILAGNRIPKGTEPLAMAYAGHQFGNFVPLLGDGRAILLGETVGMDNVRRDVQLKGSGRTPFSGFGDGRAWIGPVLREYIVSEAMAALGIPTTRSLAVVTTGEPIMREVPVPGAVLTRVARSHVRVGTFQYFAARRDTEAMRFLADHVIERLYPEIADTEFPYRSLLDRVVARQAALVAKWMHVGFIHGVMNTDNTSIAGETIDYGPCAFMDAYHPSTVYSSIDTIGRYAFQNQPYIAHWNLACLAQALLPLLSEDADSAAAMAQSSVDAFPDVYDTAYLDGLRKKFGFLEERDGDRALAEDLFDRMAANRADFTLTFRGLTEMASAGAEEDEPSGNVRTLFENPRAFDTWADRWRRRLELEPTDVAGREASMRAANPAFIPRNHRVEAVINSAVEQGDYEPFHRMVSVLANPYDDQPGYAEYGTPPRPEEVVHRTFCGT